MKIAMWTLKGSAQRYSRPEDISPEWELTFLPMDSSTAEAIRLAAGAEVLVADPIRNVSAELLEGMPGLRLVQTEGVGYNRVDLDAAGRLGITVCNNAGVNAGAVAEQAVLLMLAVLRRLHEGETAVYAGRQIEMKSRCMAEGLLMELSACRVGLVGMGAIGRETAKRLRPFGCQLCYYDPFRRSEAEERQMGLTFLPLEELLRTADIVSLHLPVTEETVGIVNKSALAQMKEGAVLINTARGELVDQPALCQALCSGRLGGAGLDTLSPEPVRADNPLLNLPEDVRPKVVLSPHIGGITYQAFLRSYHNIWDNVRRYAAGEELRNVVFRPEKGNRS